MRCLQARQLRLGAGDALLHRCATQAYVALHDVARHHNHGALIVLQQIRRQNLHKLFGESKRLGDGQRRRHASADATIHSPISWNGAGKQLLKYCGQYQSLVCSVGDHNSYKKTHFVRLSAGVASGFWKSQNSLHSIKISQSADPILDVNATERIYFLDTLRCGTNSGPVPLQFRERALAISTGR